MAHTSPDAIKRTEQFIKDKTYISRNGEKRIYYPDRLHNSGAKQYRLGKTKLGDGYGVLCRSQMMANAEGKPLRHIRLALKYVGLKHLENEETLWSIVAILTILVRLKQLFNFPFIWKIEAGWNRKVHIHIITTHSPFEKLHGRIVNPSDLARLARYFSKPPIQLHEFPDENDFISLDIFLTAKKNAKQSGKNLPRLSGTHLIPRNL